jgi:hypothetical protein
MRFPCPNIDRKLRQGNRAARHETLVWSAIQRVAVEIFRPQKSRRPPNQLVRRPAIAIQMFRLPIAASLSYFVSARTRPEYR